MTPDWEKVERLQEFVKTISYKPGWRFEVVTTEWDTGLLIGFDAPDANHPERTVPVQTIDVRFGYLPSDHWVAQLRAAIRSLEFHEVDEWLCIDGVRVREPHPPLPRLERQ